MRTQRHLSPCEIPRTESPWNEKKDTIEGVLFSMVTRTGIEPMLQP